jgi:hypothetical protein
MKFPFYRKAILHTRLTIPQAIEALSNNITIKPDTVIITTDYKTKFTGQLHNNSFKIRHAIRLGNSPVISGHLSTLPNGTQVVIEQKLPKYALVFLSIWMGALIFVGITELVTGIKAGKITGETLIPFVMLAIGLSVFISLFNAGFTNAKDDLIAILKSPVT